MIDRRSLFVWYPVSQSASFAPSHSNTIPHSIHHLFTHYPQTIIIIITVMLVICPSPHPSSVSSPHVAHYYIDLPEFFGAPTVIFLFVHSKLKEFSVLDAGGFLQTLMLSAHARGEEEEK